MAFFPVPGSEVFASKGLAPRTDIVSALP
ncbi:MAG: hypothetical protein QOC63_5251, partial [Mycobacterium sp.]|nr:hypothetical protein [Mycobacterium sp.]